MKKPCTKTAPMILAVIIALSLSSCAITHMSSWSDPAYRGGAIKKFAVYGLYKKSEYRTRFEKSMVGYLKKQGIQAVASVDFMPAVRVPSDRDREIERVTHAIGADGILIFRVASIKKEASFLPGDPHYYFSYYWSSWDEIHRQKEESRITEVILDMRLYSNSTNRLVWSARSETFVPESIDEAVVSIGGKLVKSFREKGLVAEKSAHKQQPHTK